ncbi:MAG: SDR family NAD(P)-dependent oxidoreductase [Magnetococcales bacterium]|nr:SDR family NAD(P)-dependent oxidoreductase [Magnetococcales bacterium]
MPLTDRVALITGAGNGIGRAVAQAYAAAGATSLLLGRRRENLATTYDLITAAAGKAVIVPIDLENELHAVPDLVAAVYQRFGRLDILVNNAAEFGLMTPLSAYDPVLWEKVLRVNLTAPFFLTRELLPLLQRSEKAFVINVICEVARHPSAYWGAYGISKAALLSMSHIWAQELAHTNVSIHTIDVAATATKLRKKAYPAEENPTLLTPEQAALAFVDLVR